jgi:hypothetical protein
MKIINKDVREAIKRLRLYLRRIEYDLAAGTRGELLTDLALLSEASNRAWHLISSDEQ